jgi:hypothetical protein
MNTEPQRMVVDPREDYDQLISAALFWVLFGALASLCVVVVAVGLGQALS